ncbi:transposase [Hylemonella gracilis]|uniref:Transposase n=1 Tax=Hylemonella gracilis TaxID=80880 RepID=A0A4P6ULN2_9BURK|nr:IS3 family transposase [Hylemonella gracilis]QBK06112.1 transposase [Hylemonella gracilis]
MRPAYKLADLLQIAGLARGTFHCQCQTLQRSERPGDMEAEIRAVYDTHKGRYGYRRITAALCRSMAAPVNHKCVQRLMQKMGLRALIRAKKRSGNVSGMSDAHVPNVLQRDFFAKALNQKWVTDVTEFNVNDWSSPCWPILFAGAQPGSPKQLRPSFDAVPGQPLLIGTSTGGKSPGQFSCTC